VLWDRVFVFIALLAIVLLLTANALTSRSSVTPPETTPEPAPDPVSSDRQSPCPETSATPITSAPPSARAGKTVALTFDDGPGPATPSVLRILRHHDVRATFFVVGEMVAARPELLQQIAAEGHAIGNHSWSHSIPDSSVGWKRKALTREIRRTQSVIRDVVGEEPCYFRPPGGVVKGARRISRAERLSMALWSIDTRDWTRTSAVSIRKRAKAGLTQHSPVVLLHDGGSAPEQTVRALPGIIADYKAKGYEFVTFSRT
jgi:peptidoglycan/xylan/chitin deacetylase (PgdA/CDA1 family)